MLLWLCPCQVTEHLPLLLCSEGHNSTTEDIWRSGLVGSTGTDSDVGRLKLTSVKATANITETQQKWPLSGFSVSILNSPKTNREPVLLAFPRSFSAKQVYLPSSARVTLRISRLPSSQMNTLGRKQRKNPHTFATKKRNELHNMKNSAQREVQKSSVCLYVHM